MSYNTSVGSREVEMDFSDDDFDETATMEGSERGAHTAEEATSLLAAESTTAAQPNQSGKKARNSGELDQPGKGTNGLKLWATLLIAGICLIVGVYLTGVLRDDEVRSDSEGDDLTVSNYYTELNGDFATKYPWSDQYLMVEPHITTTLTLSSAVYESLGEDVQWEIEIADGSYIYPTGRIVTASFNDTGFRAVRYASASSSVFRRRRLSVAAGCTTTSIWACFLGRGSSGSSSGANRHSLSPQKAQRQGLRQGRRPSRLVVSSTRGSNAPLAESATTYYTWTEVYLNCLYVRRELRTLSDDDRDAFFDAAEVVYRTPTAEGQPLYGSKYYGVGTFAMDHNVLAGNSDCDHMHDGLGFITNHVAQTVQFEQALQSVNPRASVPYWDYTIDVTAYETSGDISSFFGSTIFGSDYFGSSQSIIRSDADFDDDAVDTGLVNPSGRILSGRFTQVEVSTSYWGEESGPVQNAYGHIRSPWNNNNDPYVNRFNMTYGFSAVGDSDSRRKLFEIQSDIAERRLRSAGEASSESDYLLSRRRQPLQESKGQEVQDGIGKLQQAAPAAQRGSQNERQQPKLRAGNRMIGENKVHQELKGPSSRSADTTAQRKMGGRRKLSSASTQFGSADCSTIYDAMQYTTWYDFGKKIEYSPHGPVHTLIGGTYGADYKSTIKGLAAIETVLVEAWALLAFGIFKDMWRAGEVTCPTSCSADTSVEDCKCYCPDLDQWTKNSSTAKAKLIELDSAIWSSDDYTVDANGDDISAIILKTLCNSYEGLSPVIGESLQSSSPLDITFWPTHPNVDRLLHWKRIATGFEDLAWGPNGVDANASCYGHAREDKLIWKNLFDSSDYYYTNGELYNIFDPTPENAEDYQLPYVYDTFLWEHCEDMGYPATLFDDGLSTSGAGDDGVDDGRVDDDGDDASLAGEDIGAAADDYE